MKTSIIFLKCKRLPYSFSLICIRDASVLKSVITDDFAKHGVSFARKCIHYLVNGRINSIKAYETYKCAHYYCPRYDVALSHDNKTVIALRFTAHLRLWFDSRYWPSSRNLYEKFNRVRPLTKTTNRKRTF